MITTDIPKAETLVAKANSAETSENQKIVSKIVAMLEAEASRGGRGPNHCYVAI